MKRWIALAAAMYPRSWREQFGQEFDALLAVQQHGRIEQVFRRQSMVVVLDGLQDPGNAGAVVRAAEAFGATAVLTTPGTVSAWNQKAMRASAGSVFRVPLIACVEAEEILEHTEISWYAAMPRAQKLASEADLAAPCGIIIGSEGRGISSALAARAAALRIPTWGVESLNAAVAAGILLYEARRQRGRSR